MRFDFIVNENQKISSHTNLESQIEIPFFVIILSGSEIEANQLHNHKYINEKWLAPCLGCKSNQ